jgi:anti-anti-sigma regulatory factor
MMKHKFWYDDNTNVYHQQVNGDFSTEEALALASLYENAFKGKPYRQVIIDLTNATKMESRETRHFANRALDQAGITDVAYIGASSAVRMIAKVLMKLGNLKAKNDFFKTEEEGFTWLMDRRKKK